MLSARFIRKNRKISRFRGVISHIFVLRIEMLGKKIEAQRTDCRLIFIIRKELLTNAKKETEHPI